MHLPIVLCLGLVLLTSVVPGQTPHIRDEVEVRLVNIDVVVVDRDGTPVAGLEREDFVLRRDGKPVAVTHFASTVGGRPATEATASGTALEAPNGTTTEATRAGAANPEVPPRHGDERLHLVLYVDHTYLEPGDLADLVPALQRFLRESLGPEDRVMLLTADRAVRIERGLTSPALLGGTLDGLTAQLGSSRATVEYQEIVDDIGRTAALSADGRQRSRQQMTEALLSQIEGFNARLRAEVELTTAQMAQVVEAVAGLPGRRQILYVGGRIPTQAGRSLYETWQNAFGLASTWRQGPGFGGGGTTLDDLPLGEGSAVAAVAAGFDAGPLFARLGEHAAARNVAFNTLDVSGLRRSKNFISGQGAEAAQRGGSAARVDAFGQSRRMVDTKILPSLAKASGGRALVGSRDFATALAALGGDLRTYYTLSFTPPDDDRLHKLTVKLKRRRRGYEVRHRRNFRTTSRDDEMAARTVSALLLPEETNGTTNPLALTLHAGPATAVEAKVARVPLTLTVPLARLALVPEGASHVGRLAVYLTAGDLDRGAAQVQKVEVPVRIANDEMLTSLGRLVEYRIELPVPAGARRVAATVRDAYAPLSATVTTRLGMPPTIDP